jgi:hypothetical protein
VSDPGRGSDGSGPRRWTIIVWMLVAVVFLWLLIFLHLTGAIGPGAH